MCANPHCLLDESWRPTYFKISNPTYIRLQINLYRMFFVDFPVNSQSIFMKFCKDYFRGAYREIFIWKYCIAKKLDYLACNAIQGWKQTLT